MTLPDRQGLQRPRWLALVAIVVLGLAVGSHSGTVPDAARGQAPTPTPVSGGTTPTRSPSPQPTATPTEVSPPIGASPVEHTVEILNIYPHDRTAFTQGLEFVDGRLFESTGRRGASTVREVDPTTGAVLRQARLPATDFGEGLARVDDSLIQLTWQEGVAHVWDLETFAPRGLISYEGEGWGLCFDGERLIMTDGSDRLFFRDPESLALLGSVEVTLAGQPLEELNELECVDGRVWANIWFEDDVVAIDPTTGAVTHRVDASALADRVAADYPSVSINVLNGIAYDEQAAHWWLTGKLWPAIFEVDFVPVLPDATPTPTVTATTTPTPTAAPVVLPRLEGPRR